MGSVTDARFCERSDLGCMAPVATRGGKLLRFCTEHMKPKYSKSAPEAARVSLYGPAISRPSWDQTWMAVAESLAHRSRCSRAQIGCVIVSADNKVLAASYNGPARNFSPANRNPNTGCRSWCPRAQEGASLDPSYANCVSCHGEQNAIARCQGDPTGGTVYVNGSICINCAKLIAAAGLSRAVMQVRASEAHRNTSDVVAFLTSCGVKVETVEV